MTNYTFTRKDSNNGIGDINNGLTVRQAMLARAAQTKRIPMGRCQAVVKAIQFPDQPDILGNYFVLVLKNENGSETKPLGSVSSDFKDIVKIHEGQAIQTKNGQCLEDGWGLRSFCNSMRNQIPDCENMNDDLEVIEYIETMHPDITVWYSRTEKGYLNVFFSNFAYRKYGLHDEDAEEGILDENSEDNGMEI